DRFRHGFGVVAVHGANVPAVGPEPGLMIIRHGKRGRTIDRDAVVVIEDDQPAEPEMTGERPRLMTDTFHQIAVTGDDVGPVVDDFGPVLGREMTFGEGHADRSRQSLAERAGRGLDPGGVPILRVTGRAAPELPEVLDVVQGYRIV